MRIVSIPHVHQDVEPQTPSARCHACGHYLKLSPFGKMQRVRANPELWIGIAYCPRPECFAVIIYERTASGSTVHPPAPPEFDYTNVPPRVRAAIEEALKCRMYECFHAAASMIRRSLELLCEDKGHTGGTLHARLKALESNMVVPNDLLEALHNLKFLGNDAVHADLKDFDAVGTAEVDAAIGVLQVFVHSLYGYSAVLSRLKALKK